MTSEELAQLIQALSRSVAQLHTRAAEAPLQQATLLTEALRELDTSLDSLTAAQEQLRVQKDELITVREALEAKSRRLGASRDLAERERADQVLGRSEQLLERTFSSLRDALFIIDADSVEILDCNRAASQIFGYSREEMLGRTTTFLHVDEPALAEFRRRLNREMEEKGYLFLPEFAMKRQDGTVFPTEHSVMPLEDEQGERIGWVSLVRDITERIQAEEAMRHLAAIVESSDDAIIGKTLDGAITSWNVGAEKTYGYSAAEIVGRPISLLIPPEPEDELPNILGQIRQGIPIDHYETVRVRKDGSRMNFSVTISPIRDSTGKITGASTIGRDITERKRTEDELQRRADEFAALYETTHDLGTRQELRTLLQAVGERAVTLLHSGSASIFLFDPARGDLEIAVISGPELPLGARLQLGEGMAGRVAQTREPMIVDDYQTWEGRAPQFGEIPFAASVEVPMLYQGELVGVLAVNELGKSTRKFAEPDVRLLSLFAAPSAAAVYNARLFEQIITGRERLQAVSRQLVEVQEMERRRLASELHDEIGQTLTGLGLTLERARRLPPEQADRNLERAEETINEMIGRVRDLALRLRPAMLDDLGLLPALLWLLDRYTEQTKVRVVFEHRGLEERRFTREIETAAFRIVQEALTNVARHAHVDEAVVNVWSDEDRLNLQVADQGIGFDPESVRASNRTAGLSGMHERVVLLGGQFAVESSPGEGTLLTAELPLSGHMERRERPR